MIVTSTLYIHLRILLGENQRLSFCLVYSFGYVSFFDFIRRFFFSMRISFLVSCALASPFYFHYGIINEFQKQCVLLTDEYVQRQFRIYTVTLYYFIPLIIILICYTRLLYYVYSKEKKLQRRTVEFSNLFVRRNLFIFIRNPMPLNGQKNVVL